MRPMGETIFATAVYGYVDIASRKMTYVQAGSSHGIYVPAENKGHSKTFSSGKIGPALGLIENARYTEEVQSLKPNDEIILYTDGLVEAAMAEEEFSEARLIEFLDVHRKDDLDEMLDSLITTVQGFINNKEFADDVCLVGMRFGDFGEPT